MKKSKLSKLSILLSMSLLMACGDKDTSDSKNKQEDKIEMETNTQLEAPDAEQIDSVISYHGHDRNDPYFWMRLSDEQKEADTPDAQTQRVLDYLNAENAYKKAQMASTESLQKTIYDEIVGRIKEDEASYPYLDNGYYYYERYEKGKDYEIICRKKGSVDAEEEILIDVNEYAKGKDYYDIAEYDISPNNKILAYTYDEISRRQYKVQFRDIETGKLFEETLENTSGDITWAEDNKTIYYVTKDPQTLRENKVWKHILGTNQSEDVLIFEESDETFYCEVSKSKSNRFIFIDSYSTISTEHQFIEADKPDSEFRIIQKREDNLLYSVEHFNDEFYVLCNLDAINFKLMTTSIYRPEKANWREFLPYRPEVRLKDIEVFANKLVILERENGLSRLRIMNHDRTDDHYIKFDEETYTASISTNVDFNSNVLRYDYSSLKVPASLYDYDMGSKENTLLKQKEIIGGYNPDDYETERVWAKAKDGKMIPISMVYKKGIVKDGTNPLLLYGYGSYGVTIPDRFSAPRLSLLDRGFIYAIAHIRGSEYLGREWYEDGKKLTKMNTFTDFIACSDFLIEQKYTSKDKQFAMGGSAGGLLMGAVINLKPENFKGVVAAVPFVDVVSTMLDESIPLTTGEFDEWGNPKDKEYYDYMLSYSPYDQIKAQNYPNLLITTGYWDSQVQYWEPAKWIAKLRDVKTDNNMLIMDCNMSTGHGGASGRYEAFKETALEYAFLIHLSK